ncbi:hypothetical protein ACQCQP_01550 [Ralstonia pseudosolanacearum]
MVKKIGSALLYAAALTCMLCIHACALYLDEEAQTDLRVRTAHKQA